MLSTIILYALSDLFTIMTIAVSRLEEISKCFVQCRRKMFLRRVNTFANRFRYIFFQRKEEPSQSLAGLIIS